MLQLALVKISTH